MRPHSLHGIYTLISVLPFQSSRGILGGRIPASLLVLVIVLCVFSFTSIFPVCFTLTLYFLETTHVGIQQIPTFPCTYKAFHCFCIHNTTFQSSFFRATFNAAKTSSIFLRGYAIFALCFK